MSNKTEREAFKTRFRPTTDVREILERNSFTNAITEQMWRGFQAGAAYQREQDKKLVEALKLSRAYMVEEAKYEEQAFNELKTVDAALAAHKAGE